MHSVPLSYKRKCIILGAKKEDAVSSLSKDMKAPHICQPPLITQTLKEVARIYVCTHTHTHTFYLFRDELTAYGSSQARGPPLEL